MLFSPQPLASPSSWALQRREWELGLLIDIPTWHLLVASVLNLRPSFSGCSLATLKDENACAHPYVKRLQSQIVRFYSVSTSCRWSDYIALIFNGLRHCDEYRMFILALGDPNCSRLIPSHLSAPLTARSRETPNKADFRRCFRHRLARLAELIATGTKPE